MRRSGVVALAVLILIACNSRTPLRWELPPGFVGWTIVQYERADCPRLPVQGGYRVIHLDERGRACTSDRQESGDAFDKYFYVDPTGSIRELDQGRMVWGGVYFAASKRSFHFVGSESDYRASSDNSERLDQECSSNPGC